MSLYTTRRLGGGVNTMAGLTTGNLMTVDGWTWNMTFETDGVTLSSLMLEVCDGSIWTSREVVAMHGSE